MTEQAEAGHFEPVQVYFDDLDPMGLLHNARYSVLVERAIVAYWTRRGWSTDITRSAFKDVYLALREVTVSYHVPIATPGEYVVHFWFDKLGRTSGVYGFRVLSANRETVHAEGRRVNVNLDPQTFRPTPFSDDLRIAAQALLREHVPS